MTLVRIARASDSIWHTADLEFGDPYEDEASWFRDRKNMYQDHGDYSRNNELMTLVPGWSEARRKGWKTLGTGVGPFAYRGSGDGFEFIKPKHITPDDSHWDNIPQRWMRYSLGEGGRGNPSLMHADTFKDAIDDRRLSGWSLYKSEYNPETEEFNRVRNNEYPKGNLPDTSVFDEGNHYDWVRGMAEEKERKASGEI